jgi:hypothetical protein
MVPKKNLKAHDGKWETGNLKGGFKRGVETGLMEFSRDSLSGSDTSKDKTDEHLGSKNS